MWNLKKVLKMKEGRKKRFESLANEWLEYKKNSIKESTYCNYLFIIEKYLNPYFKNEYICNITNYNNLIQDLSKKLAPKTIRDIICILIAILKYYEEEYEYILKIKKANLPKLNKSKIEVLTKKEKRKLENYCMNNLSLETLGIIISLNTGMRIGEICSLKWNDVDIGEKIIKVKNTIQRIYNKRKNKSSVIIGTAKTDNSIREIPMNKKLYEILRTMKKFYSKDSYVLSGNTKAIEPRRYQKVFKYILKKSRIKQYKFHILRHTFATECIEVGMDIKSLSEILGHANVNITLKTYVHSTNEMKKKYLEKL